MAKPRSAPAPPPASTPDVDELDEPLNPFGDDDDDEEEEEEEPAPPPRNRGGRPPNPNRTVFSATAVFKTVEDFQDFEEEALKRELSVSGYALEVLLNRHNTVEGVGDMRTKIRQQSQRILALEGAKEQLQALFEQERERTGGTGGSVGGLSGFDDNKPVGAKDLQRLISEGIAERDRTAALARLPELEAELTRTKKELADLQDEYDNLEDDMVKRSDFEANVKTYGGPVIQGLAGQFPDIARKLVEGPLGALAGLGGGMGGIGAGPTESVSSDPLVTAALRTRDNISPKQGRDLEHVLDAVGRHPEFIERFAKAVYQYEQAQAAAPPTPAA